MFEGEWLRRLARETGWLQGAIFFFGGASVHILARPGWEWLGYCLAAATQPLWLVDSWQRRQWGLFGLSLFYTWQWLEGAVVHFPANLWGRIAQWM